MRPQQNLKERDVGRVLNHKITIQTKAPNGALIDLDDYKDYVTVFAELSVSKSKLATSSAQDVTRQYRVYVVRHRGDLNESMRIKDKATFWQIESIYPLDSDRLYDEITAYRYYPDYEAGGV